MGKDIPHKLYWAGRPIDDLSDTELVDVIKFFESREWHDRSEMLCGILNREQRLAAIEVYAAKDADFNTFDAIKARSDAKAKRFLSLHHG